MLTYQDDQGGGGIGGGQIGGGGIGGGVARRRGYQRVGSMAPRPIAPPRTPLPDQPLELGDASSAPPIDLGGSGLTPRPLTPPTTPLPSPTSGYATMTPYGPGNDLQGTAITPSNSAATTAAGTTAQQAGAGFFGYQQPTWTGVGAGSYAPGADTTGVRSQLASALANLNGPDRAELAAGNYRLMNQLADEQQTQDVRRIGQGAAKFGRIGSGITTSNLGDLGERAAIARERAGSQLSLDAAGQTLADRLNVANAVGSGLGTLGGEDRANAGVSLGMRNEARGERDAANAFSQQGFNNAGTQYGAAQDALGTERAYDAAMRGELRGERDFQTGRSDTAFGQNLQSGAAADAASNAAMQRWLAMYQAGAAGNPTGAYQTAAGQTAANAGGGMDDWAAILASLRRPQAA